MPKFTVWLSEEDYKAVLNNVPVKKTAEGFAKMMDIGIDLVEQVAGVPEAEEVKQ